MSNRRLRFATRCVCGAALLLLSACDDGKEVVVPLTTVTPLRTARPTAAPRATRIPTRTLTAVPTVTRTAPRSPTTTRTRTRTSTPTRTFSPTRSFTPTRRPTPPPTFTSTPTPVPTPPNASAVVAALRTALDPFCDTFGVLQEFSVDGERSFYEMRCVPTAGHSGTLTIESFGNEGGAEAELFRLATAGAHDRLHGLLLATSGEPFREDQGRVASWVWQTGCWVVHATASDDTDSLLAPDPSEVSEAVYSVAQGLGLFESCPESHDDRADLVAVSLRSTVRYGSCRGPFAFLQVCVANTGRLPASAFLVSIDGQRDEFLVESGLRPGERQCFDRTFHKGEVSVELDRDHRVTENDRNNNLLTTMPIDPTVPPTCPLPTSTPTPPSG